MEFKIGDRVRVKRGWISDYENEKGTIIDLPNQLMYCYNIKFDDSGLPDGRFSAKNIKLVENKANLKIGDLVRILDKTSIYYNLVGKIELFNEKNVRYPITVRFDNGNISFYKDNLLEKVDSMESLRDKYKEAYKQYEETKEIEKDLRSKTSLNIKKQNELMETISSLGIDILKEAKK